MSLIAGRGCRWPPRRDSVSPVRTVVGGGRDTHDGHENSPILVFFSNLLVTLYWVEDWWPVESIVLGAYLVGRAILDGRPHGCRTVVGSPHVAWQNA